MIEGTAPAIVLQSFDSPNLSPLCLQYNALPARLTEQVGRGWVSQIFVRRRGGAVPSITDIYSLDGILRRLADFQVYKTGFPEDIISVQP